MSFFILLTHVPLRNVYTLYKYSISLIVFIKLYSYFFPAFVWFALNYRNKLQAFLLLAVSLVFFSEYMFLKNSLSNYLTIF